MGVPAAEGSLPLFVISKPAAQEVASRWPFRGDDRVHGRVPQALLLTRRLGGLPGPEHALEPRAQRTDCGPRPIVASVGLEVDPPNLPDLESMGEQQELGFHIDPGPL